MAIKSHLTFRDYHAADKDDCLAAFRSNIPVYFLPEELEQFEDWLTRHAKRPESDAKLGKYFVVLVNEKLVGCGGFAIDETTMEARMTWGLVHNNFHRQGIGKEFLLWRINAIRAAAPAYSIALDTTQHAAPFFEKMGFEVVKITNDSYGAGMHRYDMIHRNADPKSV